MSIVRFVISLFVVMMIKKCLFVTVSICLMFVISAFGDERFITLSNEPQGTLEHPLVLRTYFPDPGLGREVMLHHAIGTRARKYSPGKGDVEGFQEPIRGIPAAIGVHFGPSLSLCWDTTECRLLYAWQGGFLDMVNYWGAPESGRRKGFAYLPELKGALIYLTMGTHPLIILDDFTETKKPVFVGYRLVNHIPEFEYTLGKANIRVKITPGEKAMSFVKHYVITGADEVDYQETGFSQKQHKEAPLKFSVTVRGRLMEGNKKATIEVEYATDKPNLEWGKNLYTQLGCLACHSTDGTKGHGPSFAGLYGSERKITGLKEMIKVDDDYLLESIQNPMAKVVDGFPPGYMPPYPLPEKQLKSLILFLKTLKNE